MKQMGYLLLLLVGSTACSSQAPSTEEINLEEEFTEALRFLDGGDYPAAEEILLRLYEHTPETIGVGMNLAFIEEQKGNSEKAIAYLREVLTYAPNHPPAANYLASLTQDAADEQQAEQLRLKILDVRAEDYYQNYRDQAEIVNAEYAKFNIRIKGVVAAIDQQRQLIFLRGASDRREESVICVGVKSLIANVAVGDEISFIGSSPGVGKDTPKPIIIFRRLEK